jgi:hypothetical protein
MGMIRVLDFVPRCYNGNDGQIIHDIIATRLAESDMVTVSFEGVDSVPSSFVNVALISFLDELEFDEIKRRMRFVDTNSQINDMIRSRFIFEARRKHVGLNS